ncbi:MAG: F0F1 ATP synthase subunit B [Bacilli bacterium]
MSFFETSLVLGAGAAGDAFAWGTVVAQLGIFLILLFLLRKYAFGPLMKIMQDRENHIANQLDEAERNSVESKKLIEEQRELVRQARLDSQEQFEKAKRLAEEQKQGIIAEARKEAEQIKESAVRDIALEKEAAMKELKNEIASISLLIASKVVAKQLDEQDHAALIDQYIKEVGAER